MTITAATSKDLPEILEAFAKEILVLWPLDRGGPALNPEAWVSQWERRFAKGAFLFALRDEGRILGAVGGVVNEAAETGELTGFELLWFGSLSLLPVFEDECRKRGAVRVLVAHSSMFDLAPAFERRGYVEQEVIYRKELS